MFDALVLDRPAPLERRALSAGITLSMVGATLGLLLALPTTPPPLVAPRDPAPLVFLELAPAPAAAAPSGPRAAAPRTPRRAEAAPPEAAPPEIPPPSTDLAAVLPSAAISPEGGGEGGEGGDGGEGGEGAEGGSGGDGGGGEGGGGLDDPEVRRASMVLPVFPKAAMQLGLSETRCRVRFDIDASGRPTEVRVSGCPEVFHPEIQTACLRWRFKPTRLGGVARPSVYDQVMVFRLR